MLYDVDEERQFQQPSLALLGTTDHKEVLLLIAWIHIGSRLGVLVRASYCILTTLCQHLPVFALFEVLEVLGCLTEDARWEVDPWWQERLPKLHSACAGFLRLLTVGGHGFFRGASSGLLAQICIE